MLVKFVYFFSNFQFFIDLSMCIYLILFLLLSIDYKLKKIGISLACV